MAFDNCKLSRLQTGFFFAKDRTEKIGIYDTSVWQVDNMAIIWKTRSEHLDVESAKTATKFIVANPDATYSGDSHPVDESSKKLEMEMKSFKASLPPPSPTTMTREQVFNDDLRDDYIHLGRPLKEETTSRDVKATVWMYDGENSTLPSVQSNEFPITLQSIKPLLELLGMGSHTHVSNLSEFFNARLPPGFPVQVEIPLGLMPLSALVTFQNVLIGSKGFKDDLFRVPSRKDGYRPGEVIPHS